MLSARPNLPKAPSCFYDSKENLAQQRPAWHHLPLLCRCILSIGQPSSSSQRLSPCSPAHPSASAHAAPSP